MPYKYVNGTWTYVAGSTSSTSSTSNSRPQQTTNTEDKKEAQKEAPPKDNDNRETTTTKEKSDENYKDDELNILEGNVKLPPNPKIHAKATIQLTGIGTQLTGLYFVEKSKHTFSSSGYTHEITVSREGFGDSIKRGNVTKPSVTSVATSGRPEPVTPKQDPEYIPVNKWGVVTPAIGLNVRTSPEVASGNKIGAMTCGTRVYCLGKQGAWYDHKWNGQHAWSHGDYIRLEE